MLVHRLLLLTLLAALGLHPAFAQQAELELRLRKNSGFNNGSQIQGSFRLEATGPADLAAVTFLIDDQVIATVAEPPFRLDFRTGDYALGWHNLSATGRTAGGQVLVSAERRFEFISASAGWQSVQRVLLPLMAVIGVILLLPLVVPLLNLRSGQTVTLPPGAPRRYGVFGGAICRACGRPFALHWWGLNLGLLSKLDRCDYCGRWGAQRRASPAQLAAAEAAELQAAQASHHHAHLAEPSPEEALRRQLDESRFVDEP